MSASDSARRRPQSAFWGLFALVFFCCLLPVEACIEVTYLGPYTRWFNNRMMARAKAAGLVGQPAANVEAVLGPADDVFGNYRYPAPYITRPDGGSLVGDPVRTFEYYPYPFVPFSKFQVHCSNGVVTGLEMFDD